MLLSGPRTSIGPEWTETQGERERETGGSNEKDGGKTSEEREEGIKEVMRMERKMNDEAVDSGPVHTYRGIFYRAGFFF